MSLPTEPPEPTTAAPAQPADATDPAAGAGDQPQPDPEPLGPLVPPASAAPPAPDGVGPPPPAVQSTRRLIGASFDLLTRSTDDMRAASFYVGALVLGTVGPFALTSLALEVVSIHSTAREYESLIESGVGVWFGMLAFLAAIGVIVAAVESRAMAAAILGGRYAARPVGVRAAVTRSRMVFWRVVVGSIIVGIPVVVVQEVVGGVLERALNGSTDASLLSSVIVAAVVGAPLAYLLSGIVLGDVDPFEATRRSFRVFGARKLAAALVAVFETLAILLVVLGLGAGLDIALRVFDAVGIDANSGPAGLTLIAIGLLVGAFAFGTLLYTALAISLAPQVVMFVGLTRATMGLDRVRPGGDHDPALVRPGRPRFRWLTIPLRVGMLLGIVAIVVVLAQLND